MLYPTNSFFTDFKDDLTAGRSEETKNPDEIVEPIVDFIKDEDVQQQVGNLIETQPLFFTLLYPMKKKLTVQLYLT